MKSLLVMGSNIAVASADDKLGSLERLGADVTISSADPTTLAEAVRAQTGGRGVRLWAPG